MTCTKCCADGGVTTSATSGADDTRCCIGRHPTHSATFSDFTPLRGVRLGRRERVLLLAAPSEEEVAARCAGKRESDKEKAKTDPYMAWAMAAAGDRGPGVTGSMPIIESTRSARVASQRAARKLFAVGLVNYLNQIYGERRVYISLTPLGAAVVEHFRGELESGARIRWTA